jgi:1-acyl-sn-glycerol-3-phosphate acyltransferase
MFNYWWYKLIRLYAKIGMHFFYQKIEIKGLNNIPKDKPVFFVANHRNGLLDPILVAITNPSIHHFLTRASAFKNPIANKLLRSINMIPIYRIRDGVNSIAKNQAIFEHCYQVFNNNESVLIFPEGNHGIPRRIRPLSKGFTRIAFGFIDKNPKKELYIIPVGLNYEYMQTPFTKVSVIYDKPILAGDYYNPQNENKSIEKLKNKVATSLKKITTHIDNLSNHEAVEKQLLTEGFDFTNPVTANDRVLEISDNPKEVVYQPQKNSWLLKIVYRLFYLNSLFPILIWKWIKPKIKDEVLKTTFLYGLGLGLVSLFYLLQTLVISIIFDPKTGLIYLTASLLIAKMVSLYYQKDIEKRVSL